MRRYVRPARFSYLRPLCNGGLELGCVLAWFEYLMDDSWRRIKWVKIRITPRCMPTRIGLASGSLPDYSKTHIHIDNCVTYVDTFTNAITL